jgi:hypothetical protein
VAYRLLRDRPMVKCLAPIVIVAALAGSASAGTYVGLGIGKPTVGNDGNDDFAASGRSHRVMLGVRLGRVSVEGAYTGYDVAPAVGPQVVDSRSLSAALKLSFPLGHNFEVFGRGGLLHTWIDGSDAAMSMSGNGYTFSGGFEYGLDLGLARAALFVDYTRNLVELTSDDEMRTIDQTASLWTLGFAVFL